MSVRGQKVAGPRLSRLGFRRAQTFPGQAVVEMAITATLLAIFLLVTVQFAVIGNALLALGHATYRGARYAAVNRSASQSDVYNYMVQIGAPTITGNEGANLSVTLNPSTTPRDFGSPVTVSATFNASRLIVLPNPFFGLSFPTTLSSAQGAISE